MHGRGLRVGPALAAAGLLLAVSACGGGAGGSAGSGATTAPSAPASASAAPPPSGAGSGSGQADPGPTPAAAGPWHEVFADDFQGDHLDTGRWATCYDWNVNGCTNAGNHELEWYLPSQVSVGQGGLRLTAQRQPTQGSDGRTYPWTSGMVTTGRDDWNGTPRSTFTHGYFAAAIQIPPQRGMFPAFWLIAAQHDTPQEIDVAEFSGSTQFVQNTLHWQKADGSPAQQQNRYGPVDFPAGLHVFAVDWEPTSVTWYVDGVVHWRIDDPAKIPTQPMELVLNLAVGYPFAPPADVDQAQMRVAWVRAWQH